MRMVANVKLIVVGNRVHIQTKNIINNASKQDVKFDYLINC